MLQRVQSRTQGDRLLVQERVEQSKQILQKMAMAMQISRRFEIRVEEVDGMLKPELTEVWTALKTAVSAGHAMFLRMTGEAGPKEELRFLVKGFQNFFAASCIAAEGAAAEGLPDLKALLTEEHWQQMLEMLGEAWPGSYVEIVQNRLGQFKPTSKDNFLHLAARAGHRPVFQLLHKFPERHREELNQRGEEGMLPLHLAAQLGHTLLIELMLKAGSLINAEDANERLAVHIAMRNHHYSTAQFLNDRWLEIFGSAKSSERRSRKAEQLAQRMVSLNEKEFLSVASETFTELGFFSQKESVDKKRTVGALLAVFWIVADQYDQFVRGQEASNRLSKNSWEHLQDWTRNTVHLTKSHSMVSAMLVYVAIMNVGKIKPFRAAFAPEEDEPTEALARILHRSPILVPSFAKLEAEQQQIILRALKADFNFGQFLQAENLPASLFTVRQILQEGGEDGAGSGDILGFFLFRIFAAMCGVAGANSLDGSIFMTETNYKNFEVGLDTLMHLMEDGAVKVYDRFLEARARNQGLNFRMDGNRDQRALVRLACMMRAFDQAAGERIQAAWLRLEEDKRNKLVEFLNADGVKITPGFLLYHAPSFLDNAKKNEGNFPLEMIFEVLLQVYEAAAKEYAKSEQKVITVMVEALAEFAKNCKHTDVFQFVKFEIARTPGQKGEVMGNLVISPWQLVVDKHLLDGFENEAGKMFIELVPQTGLKENVYLKQHLPKIFPELGFFRDQDDHTKYLWRETLGRLLVIYWTATDQPEAFMRGQEIQKKLTENSWSKCGISACDLLLLGDQLYPSSVAMASAGIASMKPNVAASIVEKMEVPAAAEILDEMKVASAGAIVTKMIENDSHQRASLILAEMSSGADLLAELKASDAAWIVEELDANSAAGLLCDMAYVGAGYVLAELETEQAAQILQQLKLEDAAYILDDMETGPAAAVLSEMDSSQCAPFLAQMVPDAAALILSELEYDYAAAVLAAMEYDAAAGLVQELEPPAACGILSEMEPADVAEVVAVMDYDDGAATVLAELDPDHCGKIVSLMETSVAAGIVAEMEYEISAGCLSTMDEDVACNVLTEMDASVAAGVVSLMEAEHAGNILMATESYAKVAEIFEHLTEECAAEALDEMEAEAAAGIIGHLEYEVSAAALKLMDSSHAGYILENLSDEDAGYILDQLEAEDGCRIVSEVNGSEEAAAMLQHLDYADQANILSPMDENQAAHILGAMDPEEASYVVCEWDGDVEAVLEYLEPEHTADILGHLDTSTAAHIVSGMGHQFAAKLMSLFDTSHASGLVSELEYDQSADILSKLKVTDAATILADCEYYDAACVLEKMDMAKALALLRSGFLDQDDILEEMQKAPAAELRSRLLKRAKTS
ncbi:unnamed protein product [Cladocopium goreaui]|uniref:Magnesium transporter MgtE intracellular domain-containing protein n=1 Tax=Cladocopium goreaui TaxID=2562237 RepID=A0A9P1DIE9_9DINO|nr:unnamed protein product [Cladocopium goreaui]